MSSPSHAPRLKFDDWRLPMTTNGQNAPLNEAAWRYCVLISIWLPSLKISAHPPLCHVPGGFPLCGPLPRCQWDAGIFDEKLGSNPQKPSISSMNSWPPLNRELVPRTKGMVASRSGNITSMQDQTQGLRKASFLVFGSLKKMAPEEVPQKQLLSLACWLFWTIDNFQPSQCCAIFCCSLCTSIGLCWSWLQLLLGFC